MRHLLSESLVAEIETQEEAEVHGQRTLSVVLLEAKRIAEQFVDALSSATRRVKAAAAAAQVYYLLLTILGGYINSTYTTFFSYSRELRSFNSDTD